MYMYVICIFELCNIYTCNLFLNNKFHIHTFGIIPYLNYTCKIIHAPAILSWIATLIYVSRDAFPCGLTVVYEISPPLNLASRDIACTVLELTKK